jgi:hypothetical protein
MISFQDKAQRIVMSVVLQSIVTAQRDFWCSPMQKRETTLAKSIRQLFVQFRRQEIRQNFRREY